MPRRPTQKTLRSLYATLQKLEQTDSPAQDEESITELKRVLLNRIADLELSKTLETADDEAEEPPQAADLIMPAAKVEEGSPEELIDASELEKLD
jgi:hypothetical protein